MMIKSSLQFPLIAITLFSFHLPTLTNGLNLNNSPSPKHQQQQHPISRRGAFTKGATILTTSTLVASTSILPQPNHANAAEQQQLSITGPPERQELLQKIASKASDEEIAIAISKLEPLDPSKGYAATVSELGGTWELIYSVNAEAFSPLLNLPKPIRPTSLQLLGDDAKVQVGDGRVAQVLNFPILPLSLILSSGAVPVSTNPSTLEIYPPFRLEAKLGSIAKVQLVESGSDAEFRALNARDEDAQAAGRNMYKQRYLETTGMRGDLRISEVVDGDPVIKGEVFVHRRL